MAIIHFRNVVLVNEGTAAPGELLVEGSDILAVGPALDTTGLRIDRVVDGRGAWLFPGCIDDQVHFREPGLTHKADLTTESAAAAAGGITSFMEMPNTVPNTLTSDLLEEKYARAAEVSPVNYSFYLGASNSNLDEVARVDASRVCGVKVFMGSSTGNMLVDQREALQGIFSEAPTLVAVHCEDEATVRAAAEAARARYGSEVPPAMHPVVRSAEACYRSSSFAAELAEQYGTRLHILHISTARELELFSATTPLAQKRITAEACIHHLWFSDADYARLGNAIKWNPAVKSAEDRAAIRAALRSGRIDVVATDHAPHTWEEKSRSYFDAPSGGPLVEHALVAMLELVHDGVLEVTDVPRLMAHQVAEAFRLVGRGYLRPGYRADLVLVDPDAPWTVVGEEVWAKCKWSPFDGTRFRSRVRSTWVNGTEVYDGTQVLHRGTGERLLFDR